MMTGEQLRAFRRSRGFSRVELGALLQLSARQLQHLEAGTRSNLAAGSAPLPVPRYVELACAALAMGVTDYDGEATVIAAQPPLRPPPRAGRKPRIMNHEVAR